MRHGTHSELRFVESLENRCLLSGNVTAVLDHGQLLLRGDAAGNEISVQNRGGGVVISGIGGTTVNGAGSASFARARLGIRAQMGGGNDQVHLLDLKVRRNLVATGGRGSDVLTRDNVSVSGKWQVGSFESVLTNKAAAAAVFAGLSGSRTEPINAGVMQAKLNQAIRTLSTPKLGDGAYRQAIDEGMEAIYTSNLVVLPTFDPNTNAPDTAVHDLVELQKTMRSALLQGLNTFMGSKGNATPGTRAGAAKARNFIQITNEAMSLISLQTEQTNPADPNNNLLEQDDEGGTVVDSILGHVLAARQVRSPFPVLIQGTTGTPQEQVIVPPGPIGPDEIALVVKEMQGLKVIVTPRVIPIWVAPWFARAGIGGFKTVWCWEFVPAEFIKTISFSNVPIDAQNLSLGRKIDVQVQTKVVVERELLHFWRFIHKEITAVK